MAQRQASRLELFEQRAERAAEKLRQKISPRTSHAPDGWQTAPLSWWRERWSDAEIRRLFIESFLMVRNKFAGNELVPFRLNEIQRELHCSNARKRAVLKGRKGGVSRYYLARYFADAVVMSGTVVRVVPHDPDTADEFWQALQTFYENLPRHVKPATRYYSQDLIEFFDPVKGTTDSRITTQTVQPGSEDKGRGQAITRLHLTEVPFYQGDQAKALLALLEAAAEGEIVAESTAGGVEGFHGLYTQGKAYKGGWRSQFFEWWWKRDYQVEGARIAMVDAVSVLAMPGEKVASFDAERLLAAQVTPREKWVCWKIRNHLRRMGALEFGYAPWWSAHVAPYLAWRRQKIEAIGADNFAVEYPENDVDCFALTGRPLVNERYLKVTCSASEPIAGHWYTLTVDASLGLANGDPAAIQIVDDFSGRQVFAEENHLPPDLLASRVGELSDKYNGALIVPERNGPGIALINELITLGYETRIYRELSAEQRRNIESGKTTLEQEQERAQWGFQTTNANKGPMGLELERAIRSGDLGLSHPETVAQLRLCVWNDNGKGWAARSGYHDDLSVALAINCFVRRVAMGSGGGFVGVPMEFGSVGLGDVTTSSFVA